jgi:predicted ATPase
VFDVDWPPSGQEAEQFPETAEIRPELLAHHFAEGGLNQQAIAYLQRAGERAIERSAYAEAIGHLARGLELDTSIYWPLGGAAGTGQGDG